MVRSAAAVAELPHQAILCVRGISERGREMEASLHVYSAHCLTLQLPPKCFPLSASYTSSAPTRSWRSKASRQHATLTWVRGQRQSALIRITALLNGNGGDVGHYEDEWHAMDASHVKALFWQALKRWGLPVAVGACVGSVVARQMLVFIASFSFLLFAAAHQVLEAQGAHVNSVSDVFSRHTLHALLHTSKLITNSVVLYLPVALMACGAYLKSISMYIHLSLANTLARLRPHGLNEKGFLSRLKDWLPLDNEHDVTNPVAESQSKSTDSIICDINACIEKVEGMIQTGKGPPHMQSDMNWNQLRDNLTLLKTMVADVHVKGEGNLNDVVVNVGSTVERSVKSQRRKRKQRDIVKVQSNMVDNISINSTVHGLEEDFMQGISNELDVVGKLEDTFSPHEDRQTGKSTHSITASALNGAALDQESVVLSTELSRKVFLASPTEPLDAGAVESEVGNGSLSDAPQPKYVDYWTQDDQNGSGLPSGSWEPKNKEHSSISNNQREGLGQGKCDFKAPDRENFWVKDPQSTGLVRDSDLVKVSLTRLNDDNLAEQKAGGHKGRHGPENSVADSESNVMDYLRTSRSVDAEPASLTRENVVSSGNKTGSHKYDSSNNELRHNKLEDERAPGAFAKEQKSTQLSINGSKQTNDAVEQNNASLGSTKELAFVRENQDMHALTGFSRRINDEEFQRRMNEGEHAFRNGKAGLLGKIEVGEAETMLYKAADLFASAAAIDSSSVEALGFWGNTLLVHGELKLMLSRELRYMISTPDVISSYQIRQRRINETGNNRNRAALQQTFQAVCEECEELLIQAGRKYRLVLSISNSEIRALYNWGLALCFRAQLIAEEGGQNACKAADKVYLAAIDKFEAIMGISRRYAPGAMLNWGLTLRDRSRLRPMNSLERIDLLQQAKQLFQDALRLQPDDTQIQSALITCGVELKELQERKEFQSKRSTRSFFGN